MITVTAPIWLWTGEKGGWHFVTIPPQQAVEIRLQSLGPRAGFGSVRVAVAIGDVAWRTSLFPESNSGGYVLPIKADVRRRAGIAAGDAVTLTIEVV